MKPWIKSKTNGFGSALIASGLAIATLPELRDVIDQLPAEYQGYIVFAIGIIVMILRHVTTSSLNTNPKGRELEFAMNGILNYVSHIESILASNHIPFKKIQSPSEIEDKNMRYLYTIWDAMGHAIKLKRG